MYLWAHMSYNELETLLSWKPGVHKLDGVTLPKQIEYTLSLNLKYLFEVRRKPKVAYDWFEELSRKARLMTFFWQPGMEEPGQGQYRNDLTEAWQQRLPFPKSGFNPVITNQWFEDGLQAGRRYLSHALHGKTIPQPERDQDILRRITVSPKDLQTYLTEAQLLSFISDKNLGIVVVTCHWYRQEIQKFMDLPVFRRYPFNFEEFRIQTCEGLDSLRRIGNRQNGQIFPHLAGKRMEKFWQQCWVLKDLPRFHGIPKIHKNPWKLRPIVPMHSYVTSRLALILHHMLLPVQRSFSWICESSRTLCSEVIEFNKNIKTSTRLHTGDVTSMYTSITWDDFRRALKNLLEFGNWYNEVTCNWILEASDYLWHHTIFQMGPTLVEQIDGIPMGIHCGPVFANLYMAYFEKGRLREVPTDFFYRRYIDDCFVISPSDERVDNFKVPGLTITWDHSAVELPFLDVLFHTHPKETEVCFSPYSKRLNHHQYLPWASHHPPSVKKGLVKGELTRIRAICKRKTYFLTWKKTFLSRLHARGWPRSALKSWARQVQWRSFFPSAGLGTRKNLSSVIAVSEYNPVWNEVSSTDLWDTMRHAWLMGGPPNQPYPPHCLVAKKRTKNLWDLVRSVNRNILSQEIEETSIEELSSVASTLDISMPYSPPL
jgi:hypothetical protein